MIDNDSTSRSDLGCDYERQTMKTLWDFIIKHEFWFLLLLFIGLEFGRNQTGQWWIGFLATLVLVTAIMRLASRKKDKSEE